MYCDGKTIKEIANYLNSKNIKTNTNKDFNISAVQRILKSRKYIGEYKYHEVVIEDGIPAIISKNTFENVQSLLAKNKKAPARKKGKS